MIINLYRGVNQPEVCRSRPVNSCLYQSKKAWIIGLIFVMITDA